MVERTPIKHVTKFYHVVLDSFTIYQVMCQLFYIAFHFKKIFHSTSEHRTYKHLLLTIPRNGWASLSLSTPENKGGGERGGEGEREREREREGERERERDRERETERERKREGEKENEREREGKIHLTIHNIVVATY